MNVFETVKNTVTARQAAEHYGIKVTRKEMSVCIDTMQRKIQTKRQLSQNSGAKNPNKELLRPKIGNTGKKRHSYG